MKKIISCLLAALGLTTACSQKQQPELFETDVFQTNSGKTIKIHALLHASIWIEAGDMQIMIDPVATLGNRQIDYSKMPKADYIIITHDHSDHLDKDAISLLSSEKTQLITNRTSSEKLGKGTIMTNGEKLQPTADFTIEAVPAYNTTEGHLQFHPQGRDNGYILTIDGLRIYIAGDTEDIKEMDSISDIDIAFLPCNQPYTMTPDQLIRVARIIRPKVLFPYHFGQTDLSDIPEQLREAGVEVRIRHYE